MRARLATTIVVRMMVVRMMTMRAVMTMAVMMAMVTMMIMIAMIVGTCMCMRRREDRAQLVVQQPRADQGRDVELVSVAFRQPTRAHREGGEDRHCRDRRP